jgi:hypothetical protein
MDNLQDKVISYMWAWARSYAADSVEINATLTAALCERRQPAWSVPSRKHGQLIAQSMGLDRDGTVNLDDSIQDMGREALHPGPIIALMWMNAIERGHQLFDGGDPGHRGPDWVGCGRHGIGRVP